MKAFASFLNSMMWAGYIVAIAIFSIQNVDKVSLKFLVFRSIDIPLGVLLTLCGAVGIIIGWLIPLLFSRRKRSSNSMGK